MSSFRLNSSFAASAGLLNALSLLVYLPAAFRGAGIEYAAWLPYVAFLQIVSSLDLGRGTSISRGAAQFDAMSYPELGGHQRRWTSAHSFVTLAGLSAVSATAHIDGYQAFATVLSGATALVLVLGRPCSAALQGLGCWRSERSGVLVASALRIGFAGCILGFGIRAGLQWFIVVDCVLLAIPAVLPLLSWHRLTTRREPRPDPAATTPIWRILVVWCVSATPLLLVQLPLWFGSGTTSVEKLAVVGSLIRAVSMVRQSSTWLTEPAMRELRRRGSDFAPQFVALVATAAAAPLALGAATLPVSDDLVSLWLGRTYEGDLPSIWIPCLVAASAIVVVQAGTVMALSSNREKSLAPFALMAVAAGTVSLATLAQDSRLWVWMICIAFYAVLTLRFGYHRTGGRS